MIQSQLERSKSVDLSFDEWPTLKRMHSDDSFIRAVIGPAGSAKTTCAFKDLMVRAILQEPGDDNVRYTRFTIVRNTFNLLRDITMPAFRNSLGFLADDFGEITKTPLVARIKLPLSDGTSVNAEFWMVAMDDEEGAKRALGSDITGALLEEVSELREEVITMVSSRCGRFPSLNKGRPTWNGIIATTNGPKMNHWLYEWFVRPKPEWKQYEEVQGRKYFTLFQQPPALIRPSEPGDSWRPNPAAENVHNLADGYGQYFKMISGPDDHVTAYVEGKFVHLRTGKVVFPEFNRDLHIIEASKIEVGEGSTLYFGFDFGSTPVCLIGVVSKLGQMCIIEEIVGEDTSIATLWDDHVRPLIQEKYYNRYMGEGWGDPSGMSKRDNVDLSPFGVLENRGLVMIDPGSNWIPPRLEAVKERLRGLASNGRPKLLISDACEGLIEAISEKYVYESKRGRRDEYREIPMKEHPVSDLADALQYLVMGYDNQYRKRAKWLRGSTRKPRKHLVRM